MRSSMISAGILAVSAIGCGAPAKVETTAPTSVASGSAAPSALPVPEPLAESFARLLTPGAEIHAGPISLPDGTWTAWIGSKGITRSRVEGRGSGADISISSAVPMPVGVRVTSAFLVDAHAVAMMHSLKAWDQPADLRAIDVSPTLSPPLTLREIITLGTADEAGVRAFFAHPRAVPVVLDRPMQDKFTLDSVDLARLISVSGLDMVRMWQGTFARVDAHVESAVSKSTAATEASRVAGTFGEKGCARVKCCYPSCCSEAGCSSLDDRGARTEADLVLEDGHLRTRAFVRSGVPADVVDKPNAAVATISPDTHSTKDALAALELSGRVIAEATTPTGSLGVAVVRKENDEAAVAIERDGNVSRAISLNLPMIDLARLEVGFADIDGDGAVDVMIGAHRSDNFAVFSDREVYLAFLTPRILGPTDGTADPASSLLTYGVSSMAAAIERAKSEASVAVSAAEACALREAVRTTGSLAAALAPGAKLFTYTEPSSFGLSAQPAHPIDIAGTIGASCSELVCEPGRPFCRFTNGPEDDFFVVRRDHGRLRIVAAARYTGS